MLFKKNLNSYLFIICAMIIMVSSGKVLEMDDRLIEFAGQGKWLVTFYAPWCGHCRKLEPVMDEVAKHFNDKSIAIAKIDATRYYKAANHFDIKAYPTIKFLSGKKVIDFSGERRKEDLIEFINKADSPRVTRILNQIDFEHSKTKHKHFFLLVSSPKDEDSELKKEFYELANKYFLDAYFYHASPEHVIKTIEANDKTPMVYAFKENEFFQYQNSENNQFLVDFIRNERFLTFTEITMSNFHNLIETRKTLLILNLDSRVKSTDKQTKKLKQTFNTFSKANRNINHKDFQFGYVDNSDLLNGIAIWTLETPLFFVLNTTSYTYSLFDVIDEKNKAVLDVDIQDILDKIRLGKIEFMGGQSYFRTLRRPLWELYRAIIEMFFEAPFLSLLIFGFPFGVISIVFYFLCCVDSSDQEPDEEDFESNSEDEDYYVENEEDKNVENLVFDDENEPQGKNTKKTQ